MTIFNRILDAAALLAYRGIASLQDSTTCTARFRAGVRQQATSRGRSWCGTPSRPAVRVVIGIVVLIVMTAWSVRILATGESSDAGEAVIVLLAWLVTALERLTAAGSGRSRWAG